jgi:hypothetical protein
LVFEESESDFWISLNAAIQRETSSVVKPVHNSGDFLTAFARNTWPEHKVVLILDEFTLLFGAKDSLQDHVLGQLRTFRSHRDTYAIQSIIICGTFSLSHLSPTQNYTSPFNVGDHIQNPYFSKEDVYQLFSEFTQDNNITIDENVIEDVWSKSNGYVT